MRNQSLTIAKAPSRREKNSMLTFRVTNDFHDKLAEMARCKGITISELIRRYIACGISQDQPKDVTRRISIKPTNS